jgi:hypothetical protein
MRLPPSWEIYDCDVKGGAVSVQTFVSGLPLEAKVEALAFLKLLEEFGDTLTGPHVIHGADGSFELRGCYVRFFCKALPAHRIDLLAGTLTGNDD